MRALTLMGLLVVSSLVLSSVVWPPQVVRADADPVEVGDEAPDFTLEDHLGREVTLSSYRGESAVLIAFFPQVFTRGCTLEMKSLRKERRRFKADGVQVLGISCDEREGQKRFATSLGLDFPLLSDADGAVSKRYDVFVQTADGGHAARAVFLVDRAGKVVHLDRDYAQPDRLSEPLQQALAALAPDDPVQALRDGPQTPDVRAKVTLIDLVDAVLSGDQEAVEGLFHPEFGHRPSETEEMGEVRRRAALDDWRKRRAGADLDAELTVLDVLDPAQIRVFDQESATPMRLRPFTRRTRELAAGLTGEDRLVTVRPKPLDAGPRTLFPEELSLMVREHEGRLRIHAQSVR